MFNNKSRNKSLCLFVILLVLFAILLVIQPKSASAADPTPTPDLLCKQEWAAYDDAVIKKNVNWIEDKRSELIICVVNASRNKDAEVAGVPGTLPPRQDINDIAFPDWDHVDTTEKSTEAVKQVRMAMSRNDNHIAFAIYLNSQWVIYPVEFMVKLDGAKPLVAYQSGDTVHVAVYFEKSPSILYVYHLPADGGQPASFKPAELTFSFAKTTLVDKNGCFYGNQGAAQIQTTLCPIERSNGVTEYIPYVK